jgi:hypothetical protein
MSIGFLQQPSTNPRVFSDYFTTIDSDTITAECKTMMHRKIERYQCQYAHEMALDGKIDIRVTWDCPEVLTVAAIRFVAPKEAASMKTAVRFSVFAYNHV